MDLRLRELRFDPRLFALRLADRLAFLLPPFLADAFLREARLFGAMALPTLDLRVRDNCFCGLEKAEKHMHTKPWPRATLPVREQ